MKYIVYAKFNGKWVRIKKEFDNEKAARCEMHRQVLFTQCRSSKC